VKIGGEDRAADHHAAAAFRRVFFGRASLTVRFDHQVLTAQAYGAWDSLGRGHGNKTKSRERPLMRSMIRFTP